MHLKYQPNKQTLSFQCVLNTGGHHLYLSQLLQTWAVCVENNSDADISLFYRALEGLMLNLLASPRGILCGKTQILAFFFFLFTVAKS